MSWINDKKYYQQLSSSIDKSIILTTKDGVIWHMIAGFLQIVTFGGITAKTFLENYATTIGPVQAYPRGYKKLNESTLVHEAQHTKQCRWFGFGIHPWVGLPLMGIFYLLLPLPLGFAWFRYMLEKNADSVTYRWMLRNGYRPEQVLDRAKRFAGRVCGGNYGWSYPKKWGIKSFEKEALEAIKEDAQRRLDFSQE